MSTNSTTPFQRYNTPDMASLAGTAVLVGGMLIQSGQTASVSTGTVTYPSAYTTSVPNPVITPFRAGGAEATSQVSAQSLTGFTWYCYYNNNGVVTALNAPSNYIVMGPQ